MFHTDYKAIIFDNHRRPVYEYKLQTIEQLQNHDCQLEISF